MSDPVVRGVTDVRHEVTAVASSTSAARAQKFIDDHGATATAVAYGSYDELVKGQILALSRRCFYFP